MFNSKINIKEPTACYIPNKSRDKNQSNGIIEYHKEQIPVKNILCIREVPNSYIYPKSIITLLVKNPSENNKMLATEYEIAGSLKQWTDAIKRAEENNGTVNFNAYI